MPPRAKEKKVIEETKEDELKEKKTRKKSVVKEDTKTTKKKSKIDKDLDVNTDEVVLNKTTTKKSVSVKKADTSKKSSTAKTPKKSSKETTSTAKNTSKEEETTPEKSSYSKKSSTTIKAKKTSSKKKISMENVSLDNKSSKTDDSSSSKELTTTKKRTSSSKKSTATSKKSTKAITSLAKTTSKEEATKEKSTTSKKSPTTKKVATKSKASSNKKTSSTTTKKSKKAENTPNIQVIEYYDLPYKYGNTIVKLLAQTPKTLFVYWEISDNDINNLKTTYGEDFLSTTIPILIVHNLTLNKTTEVEINDFANCWYLNTEDSDCKFDIELARKFIKVSPSKSIENAEYLYIAKSNELNSPNDHILFEHLTDVVTFKNVETNETINQNINSISFLSKMYEFYKQMYKDEFLNNPSSKF